MKILWNGTIIAESKDVLVEGSDYYFPYDSVDTEMLQKSKAIFHCTDKGYADQYDLWVRGCVLANAAWIYPHPYPLAARLKGRVGFKKHLVQ